MECKYFKGLISLYIDGYINDKEKKEIEEHLLICKDCKKYLEELKESLGILRNIEKVEAPLGFEKKVIEKIKDKEKFPFSIFNKKLLLEFSVALFALASILFVYLNLTPKEGEEIPIKIIETKAKEDLEKKDIASPEIKKEKEVVFERKKQEELKNGKSMVPKILSKSSKEEDKKLEEEKVLENEVKLQPKIALAQEFEKKVENKEKIIGIGDSSITYKVEKKIKISAKAENLEDLVLKIEDILKSNEISYKKIKKENVFEIIIKTKDLKIFLEKVLDIEEIKIEEPIMKEYEGEEVVMEILKN